MRPTIRPETKAPAGNAVESGLETGDSFNDRPRLVAAVLVALFIHLLMLWAVPGLMPQPQTATGSEPLSIDIRLQPEEEPEVPEQRYVQAPLDIAERIPEETLNISDRDQVAAQEEAVAPDPENNPAVDGDEADSNRIVQGNPRQEPTPPAPPATQPEVAETASPRMEPAPREEAVEPIPFSLPEDNLEDSEEGSLRAEVSGEMAAEMPEDPQQQRPANEQNSPMDGAGEDQLPMPEMAAQEDAPTPRPRARVERNTSYGPLRDSPSGAIRLGRLAFDARYSEFGEYWRRVAEVIEARWRNLLYNTRAIKFSGNRVAVEFDITRDGQVENINVRLSTAGRLAETISVDAIVGEAPFFKWTPEMIVVMGEQTTVQLVFIY
jgi:outer membrane biosynthesis protein TonB